LTIHNEQKLIWLKGRWTRRLNENPWIWTPQYGNIISKFQAHVTYKLQCGVGRKHWRGRNRGGRGRSGVIWNEKSAEGRVREANAWPSWGLVKWERARAYDSHPCSCPRQHYFKTLKSERDPLRVTQMTNGR